MYGFYFCRSCFQSYIEIDIYILQYMYCYVCIPYMKLVGAIKHCN